MKQKHFDNNHEVTDFCPVCEAAGNCRDIKKWMHTSDALEEDLTSEYLIMPEHLSFIGLIPFLDNTDGETLVESKDKIRKAAIAASIISVAIIIFCSFLWGVMGLFAAFIPSILITYIPVMMLLEAVYHLKKRLRLIAIWIICSTIVSIILLIVGVITGGFIGLIVAMIPYLMMTYIPLQLLFELTNYLHIYKMGFYSLDQTCVDWVSNKHPNNAKETTKEIWGVLINIARGRIVLEDCRVSGKSPSILAMLDFKSAQYPHYVIYRLIKNE